MRSSKSGTEEASSSWSKMICATYLITPISQLEHSSAPRMVNNYKRTSSPRSPTNSGELFTPAHEENVRFIHDTWQCVLRDIRSPQSSERKDRGPQEYVEKNPNPNLNSFTPVDLSDLRKRNTQDSKKS
ncbi:mapk-regulated corepressor-interacting protein 1 isoform X1 [Oncorhynchus mykiss]|uniref:mapk-regulated corepressor-interacting protein 1 isoform X1 n=1 Tax=Oncorhynchus mykiss TaxID=8022 RepID=UPI001877A7A0|nr:mapk-regulated corepressor-interacting protein 1 isoform X1 [Oncorhynchus mykiss]